MPAEARAPAGKWYPQGDEADDLDPPVMRIHEVPVRVGSACPSPNPYRFPYKWKRPEGPLREGDL